MGRYFSLLRKGRQQWTANVYPEQIDRVLNWPLGTAARLARRGKLPHYRLPDGSLRFDRAEVEALVEHVDAKRPTKGIPRAHLHRLRASGKFIAAIRLGRKLLFDREELVAWKDAKCPTLKIWEAMKAARCRRLKVS